MKKTFTSLFLFLFTSFVFEISAQIIYVDSSAIAGGNGMTWDNAFNNLQSALAVAEENDIIWVAEGTYSPDSINGDPASTFLIDKNLQLYGGFTGEEETLADRENPIDHPTILSGDLNGDDQDDDFMNFKSDNVHTVVRITSSTTNATLLDGFIIRGGHADGAGPTGENGGGIYSDGTPAIRNCTFEQNYAMVWGGGIAQFDYSGSTVILDNCHFNNNSAEGGMGCISLSPFLISKPVRLEGISIIVALVLGSALAIADPYGGTVQNCTFEDNLAYYGTAILVWRREPNDPGNVLVEILDCAFNNNTSYGPIDDIGSTIMHLVTNGMNSSYVVKGCTFNGNNSAVGGAITLNYNPVSTNASMLIDSCDFTLNTSQGKGRSDLCPIGWR